MSPLPQSRDTCHTAGRVSSREPEPDEMSALERRITVGAVVVPFLGFLVAVVLLWGGLVTGRDMAIFAVMYALTGFGVTVGFHRLLTHRSFTAPTPVRATFAVL